MQLIVIEHAGRPLDRDRRTSVVFRPPGGTIGRDHDNHLVLRDETRQISRLQALLQVGETSCSLKNLSSVSTIEVNRTSIGYAQVQLLQAGDTIRIGAYLLRADFDEGATATASAHAASAQPHTATDVPVARVDAPPREAKSPSPASSGGLQALHALPTDPLRLFASSSDGDAGKFAGPTAAADAPVMASDRVPECAAPFRLQPAPAAPKNEVPASETASADKSATGGEERHELTTDRQRVAPDVLLRAFFEGAGLDATAPVDRWSAEQLFVAGQLLALFANGTVELLSARSILKREVRADMTMLLDRENNPLKLLPDGGAALRQMFGLPFPGFMSPPSAVSDAFQDLHAHQIGMVAGMRAALTDLLARFSPQRLLDRDAEPRWYERMWPMLRKARIWERYVALHRDVVLAVEDDFSSVFGKSFLGAYDAEVERYRGRRRG